MQNFLFRGKKKSNGEWVVGYYIVAGGEHFIYSRNTYCKVVPATIGLSTCSEDKNGKRIFHGDILESRYDEKYPEDFCYEQVLWDNNGFYMKQVGCSDLEYLDVSDCATYSKVVGNIYDNPELLEER